MKLKNILLDLNGNCKISNIFHIVEENEFNRYDLPQFGYLVYQMLTGNILNNYDENAKYNRLAIYKCTNFELFF